MVFNPPTYYPEFTSAKSKRCSTGSLTESTSPNNEETSQDLSQSETPNNVSDFNHVYNVIYPGFYFNGACQPQDVASQPEPKRMKKKRRRKLSRSKSVQDGTTSEYTDESSDEVFSDHQENSEKSAEEAQSEEKTVDAQKLLLNSLMKDNQDGDSIESLTEEAEDKNDEVKEEKETTQEEEKTEEKVEEKPEDGPKLKYDLKPDAEEFVPRAYRHPETIPMEPNVQFIKIPSNFVPLPIINPMSDFNGQNFNAFIPPGIPINFIPQNYINFIPSSFLNKMENVQPVKQVSEKVEEEIKETVEVPKNQIDIAKIVSKLEEAAKEQDNETLEEATEEKSNSDVPKPLVRKLNDSGRNFKRNRYQKIETKAPEEDKPEVGTKEPRKTAWKQTSSPKKETTPQNTIAPKPITRNYSDTLKKSQTAPPQQCERHERHMEKQKLNKATPKEIVKNHVTVEQNVQKMPNQWISVSNRKKRKNKNVEETEDFEEVEEADKEKNLFENYDVKELVDVIPPPPPSPPKEESKPMVDETPTPPSPPPLPVIESLPDVKEEKKERPKPAPKKKSKKNQKTVTKRVIIKDVDLSQEIEKEEIVEAKVEKVIEEEKKVEEKTEEAIEEKSKDLIEEKTEEVIDEKSQEVIEEKKETPEKKTKKKKKKVVKPAIVSSQSSSSTTLNVTDDSYDFLLESSLLNESQEKTNVEVSQELDKMIQRGMYSSLEEKIKSLNMESNDNFFKAIIHNISRESSVEKNSFSKTPDFTKILNSTTPLLKAKPVVADPKLGDFLGESTPKPALGGRNPADETQNENLYPITRAVKEWMTKTRETTPDVEILKSPSAIFREFGSDEQKNGDGNSLSAESLEGDTGVDEVTLYSFSREGSADLDDELTLKEGGNPDKTASSSVEEGEEVLDVYDSKYGKNEDYLRIKAEVEEEKRAKANFPKHGNLPYRAICCSIM
ncbi:titin-like [Asbolus verrucosus]|uniref:Titin-like n=1 Tax=Asbolus verrucosus TaxID=1661398 RepID=A0A482VY61_ASBVE|nr:titin-like [Asbolus verrucosus]